MTVTTTESRAAARQTVADWLASFNHALRSGDTDAAAALFCAEGHWRDVLALTWTIHTASGGPAIADVLRAQLSQARLGASGGFLGPRGAVLSLSGPVLGPSAWLLGRPWVAPDRSEPTGPRGTHVRSSPKIV